MTESINVSGAGAITSALSWFEGTLLGTFATTIAILAVAMVGFLMFTGRIDVRRGALVVLGCFIIFGASAIANGLLLAVSDANEGAEHSQAPLPPPPQYPAPVANQPTSSSPFDPYAGAAIQPH